MPYIEDTVQQSYVEHALAQAFAHYSKRNPMSLAAHQSAHNDLPGGNTRTVLHAAPFPLTWKFGHEARLSSIDGHTYIDLLGEFSAGLFGHSDARIVHAIQKSMLSGWNFGGNSVYEKDFARKVHERFEASGVELVRFTNSGTEANTTALAAAVAITRRKKILVFSGGYHGSTLVFPIALMKGSTAPSMNLPHDFVHAPYNNITETDVIIKNLPQESLAAILVEPVQGSGGCRPATKDFMQYLRQVADATGAILIIDEVMSSRLGWSGCSATLDVRGDIVTLGKYVGGGMTFGAFGGRRSIMELFDPAKNNLFHPGTYNNNVFSMNAGMVGLDIYDKAEVERLNRLGDKLKKAVQQILMNESIYPRSVTNNSAELIETDSFEQETQIQIASSVLPIKLPSMFITGRGSMLNIRFSGSDALSWQALFYHHMLARNIYIATRGYTPLNLCLSNDDVERYVEAIQEFVREHKSHLVSGH